MLKLAIAFLLILTPPTQSLTEPPANEVHAVIDRVVEGLAVILVGDAETETHIPIADLPAGAGEGTRLTITIAD